MGIRALFENLGTVCGTLCFGFFALVVATAPASFTVADASARVALATLALALAFFFLRAGGEESARECAEEAARSATLTTSLRRCRAA